MDAPPRTEHVDASAAGEWIELHPRVVTRWRLEYVADVLILVVPLVVGEALLRNADWLESVPPFAAPAAVGFVGVVLAVVLPPVQHRRWRYRLADDALEIRRGIVVERRSVVPYRRVQQVDLARGPLDRLFGLVRAELTTAAATTDGSIPGLTPDSAEAFRTLVLERAGLDDAV